MSFIDNVVNIQIDRQTRGISRAGFGTTLIAFPFAGVFDPDERIRFYTDVTGLEGDFETGSPVRSAGQLALQQRPRPSIVAIGQLTPNYADVEFDGVLITGNVINVTINGTAIAPVTFDTDSLTTIGLIVAAIELAVPGVVAEAVNETSFRVYGIGFNALAVTGVLVTLGATQATATVTDVEPDIEEELSALENFSSEWYGLTVLTNDVDLIEDIADWAEPRKKLYFASSNQASILTGVDTDIGSVIQAKNYERTAILYSGEADKFPEVGLIARFLATDPGSSTVAFKDIVGIVADNLTSTQQLNARAKNVNVYLEAYRGSNAVWEGTVANGEYIDIIRDLDFHEIRLKEDVFEVFKTNEKISFTAGGIDIIESVIRARISTDIGLNIFTDDPEPIFVFPTRAEVSAANRAERTYGTIRYEVAIAGAIHKTILRGTVTV
jgi:hypothetical protein